MHLHLPGQFTLKLHLMNSLQEFIASGRVIQSVSKCHMYLFPIPNLKDLVHVDMLQVIETKYKKPVTLIALHE